MNYIYKKLAQADVEVLKKLLRVFGEAFNDLPTYQDAIPNDEYLRSLLGQADFVVMVAMSGKDVAGGLAAYVLEKFEQARKEIYIYDLAVSEQYRRQGIATRLINELKLEAKKLGAYVIYVQADKGDDPAIKLYESLGAREDVYHFDILVD